METVSSEVAKIPQSPELSSSFVYKGVWDAEIQGREKWPQTAISTTFALQALLSIDTIDWRDFADSKLPQEEVDKFVDAMRKAHLEHNVPDTHGLPSEGMNNSVQIVWQQTKEKIYEALLFYIENGLYAFQLSKLQMTGDNEDVLSSHNSKRIADVLSNPQKKKELLSFLNASSDLLQKDPGLLALSSSLKKAIRPAGNGESRKEQVLAYKSEVENQMGRSLSTPNITQPVNKWIREAAEEGVNSVIVQRLQVGQKSNVAIDMSVRPQSAA